MQALLDALAARRPAEGPYLVGVTGSVAVGKSTMATSLVDDHRDAAVLATDCFLRSNAELDAAGLTMEKGFPATFDVVALRRALGDLAAGIATTVPSYSHVTYDIEPGVRVEVVPAALVVVEGLHLTRFARDLLHTTVHLSAEPAVLEVWYLARFAELVARARAGEESFYRVFASLEPDQLDEVGRHLWRTINLVNLREHIEPWRDRADLVVELGEDHSILEICAT